MKLRRRDVVQTRQVLRRTKITNYLKTGLEFFKSKASHFWILSIKIKKKMLLKFFLIKKK